MKTRLAQLWKAWQPRVLMLFVAVIDCPVLSICKLGDHYRGATISAECFDLEQRGMKRGRIFRPLIDFALRWLEPDHCSRAWLKEHYLRKGPP